MIKDCCICRRSGRGCGYSKYRGLDNLRYLSYNCDLNTNVNIQTYSMSVFFIVKMSPNTIFCIILLNVINFSTSLQVLPARRRDI